MDQICVAFSEYLKFIFKSKAENFYFALEWYASLPVQNIFSLNQSQNSSPVKISELCCDLL